MKRIVVLVLSILMLCIMTACGDGKVVPEKKAVSAKTVEELQVIVEKDVTDTVAELRKDYDKLVAGLDTYDKYVKDAEKVEEFYAKVRSENKELCLRMREYSLAYAELVLESEGSNSEKYDQIEDMYDCIYEDAGEDIYDGIYDDLMNDMYDSIYDGVVEDGYDYAPYKEWSEVSSDAYQLWSDYLSDIYREWSDSFKDIYRFWSDVSGDILDGDSAKAKEEMAEFRESIDKLKAEPQQ